MSSDCNKPHERPPCGKCQACCYVMPCVDQEDQPAAHWPWASKPAGIRCEHLIDEGCSKFNDPDFPPLCRNYFCGWKESKYMSKRPLLRPDKLGMIFNILDDHITAWELWPNAHKAPNFTFIVSKLLDFCTKRAPYVRVMLYGHFDGFVGVITNDWTEKDIGNRVYLRFPPSPTGCRNKLN
jgi:hypothetical protein